MCGCTYRVYIQHIRINTHGNSETMLLQRYLFFPKKMPVTKISFFIPGPKICLFLSQYLS